MRRISKTRALPWGTKMVTCFTTSQTHRLSHSLSRLTPAVTVLLPLPIISRTRPEWSGSNQGVQRQLQVSNTRVSSERTIRVNSDLRHYRLILAYQTYR